MFTAGGCLTWCSATRTRWGCTGCPRSSMWRLWAARTEPSRAGRSQQAKGLAGGRAAGHELAAGVLVQAVEELVGDGEGVVVRYWERHDRLCRCGRGSINDRLTHDEAPVGGICERTPVPTGVSLPPPARRAAHDHIG